MTNRENAINIARRKGIKKAPIEFSMCPSLDKKFHDYIEKNEPDIDFSPYKQYVQGPTAKPIDKAMFDKYYAGQKFKEGSFIDANGVLHEPGSEAAFHMTKMFHPMDKFTSIEQIKSYPFLDFTENDFSIQKAQSDKIKEDGFLCGGGMQCSIWETAWYMRGMENLMDDMLNDEDMAIALLDKVTSNAILTAESYAKAGVDTIDLGDDIGMQHTIMMSESMYCEWLKPRLKSIIDAAKAINPDILFFYHSCGFVTPFIPHLIDVGIDILNPVQPECMDFKELHEKFGDRLSFNGTLGTQTTMPFGTADEVRRTVFNNYDIAGSKGGLFLCPTHLLEPEVPVENIIAYIKASNDYFK